MDDRAGDGGPYRQADLAAGEVRLWEQDYTPRLKPHQSEERCHRSTELIPLRQSSGTRTYFDLQP